MFVYISVSSDNRNEKIKVMLDWRVTIYYNLLHRYALREILSEMLSQGGEVGG